MLSAHLLNEDAGDRLITTMALGANGVATLGALVLALKNIALYPD